MTDDEFDRAIDEFAAAVITTLRDKAYKDFPTTAQLLYPGRVLVKALVSDDGDDLVEFGRALASQGNPPPPAVLVAALEPGGAWIVLSGCTDDGRRNAIRIHVERSRWRKILRPMRIERQYYRDRARIDEPTPAGDLLRGMKGNP